MAIVRYAPDHDFYVEWVWNSADIDGSKVVWSRDMSVAANAEVVRYFPDRKASLETRGGSSEGLTLRADRRCRDSAAQHAARVKGKQAMTNGKRVAVVVPV